MADDQRQDFYKDRYFQALDERLDRIESAQAGIQSDVSDIKGKVIYMYGFAAALGIVASLVIDYIRTNIFAGKI